VTSRSHVTTHLVTSRGHVLWMFPSVVKVYCTLDVRHFPFDQQRCPVVMGTIGVPPVSGECLRVSRGCCSSKSSSTVLWVLSSRLDHALSACVRITRECMEPPKSPAMSGRVHFVDISRLPTERDVQRIGAAGHLLHAEKPG